MSSAESSLGAGGVPNIGRTLISARSYDEYVAMFALTPDDLAGRVLDCPGGAASFTAEARKRGIAVTALDPVYADDVESLARQAVDEALRGNRHTAQTPDAYVWSFFSDIDDHRERRIAAAREFGDDLRANPAHYVSAALPQLPFSDRAFDLVVSSHLLFLYADRLSVDFHVAAVLEMARVAKHQVRIFPVISDLDDDISEHVMAVARAASTLGFIVEIRTSPYEFRRGGNEMLVLTRDTEHQGLLD